MLLLDSRHLGTVQLKNVPQGIWTTVTVRVDHQVQQAVDGVFGDSQLFFDLTGSPLLLVDRVRFAGEIRPRTF